MSDEIEWATIAQQLQAPFDPTDVEFRPQGKLNGQGKGRALAYVDARVVAARLDAVVGPPAWSFDWEPVILDKAVRVVKGTITIYGVPKSDIGDSDQTEPSKAAVSDALKRTAVLWGVGRYLYSLEAGWVQGTAGAGDNWYIPDTEIARLRSKLPRAAGAAPVAEAGEPAQAAPAVAEEQLQQIRGLTRRAGLTPDQLLDRLQLQSLTLLTPERAEKTILWLTDRAQKREGAAA